MYASRSYAIGIKTDKDYPGGMYISADTPPRSIRYTPLDGEKEKILIIGGENHKTGQGVNTMEHYEALQAFAEEVFGIKEYDYRWSAQDMVTLDKLPYIGHYTEVVRIFLWPRVTKNGDDNRDTRGSLVNRLYYEAGQPLHGALFTVKVPS